ncbi:hypothetical protein UA08_04000 [Talaromyces atroroseus]|uniref:Uncharacterized protein n=1 Tax=Talaromyces atroroseus TaxID=1441469 RepID=A0A1Q5Q8H8_TALAT|nr:hypothetical protein UA08_04000 [Talaromyces atroroseus]OKL60436.1 hypothetical protein UA08_04000 [Talaromyces atroroseus]
MFRPSPTWISLPDHEVYQTLQAIHHIHRAKASVPLHLAVFDFNDTDETEIEDYRESPTSPSPSFTWSSSGLYTPNMRPGDVHVLENRIRARLYAGLNPKRVARGETNDWGDASKTLCGS